MPRNPERHLTLRTVMREAKRPMTPQEIAAAAQRIVPGFGIATVYRHLRAFMDDGFVRALEIPGDPVRYELASLSHHHHFHCDECGSVFDIPGCPVGPAPRAPEGFSVQRHELMLYGKCPDCREGTR